jgi:hypothetical protein
VMNPVITPALPVQALLRRLSKANAPAAVTPNSDIVAGSGASLTEATALLGAKSEISVLPAFAAPASGQRLNS